VQIEWRSGSSGPTQGPGTGPLLIEMHCMNLSPPAQARRSGFTVRSGVDCLIAACALRHGLMVLHHDRDFDALARVSSLTAREALP